MKEGMNDIIGQIFIEVIAIFGIDEKDADKRGLWKKFEVSLKQLISQSERQVDEKLIEEKAKELHKYAEAFGTSVEDFQDFLRQFVSEIQKPRITKEFVEKWKETFQQMDGCYTPSKILIDFMEAFLKEADCEEEK